MITLSYAGRDLSEIKGFKVLEISGRENCKRSKTDDTSPKEIEVTYKIMETVNHRLADRYNELQSLLSVPEGRLIFSDEADKYWNAYVSEVTADTIKFVCEDPIKYSLTEAQETGMLENGQYTLTMTNTGTVAVPVDLLIRASAKNKYIEVHDSKGNALRIGDINAPETETVTNPILAGQGSFTVTSSSDALHPTHAANGKLAVTLVRPDDPDTVKYPECEWICLDPAHTGSGSASGAGFGGVSETAAFMTPPTDWDCYLFHWFQCNSWTQGGGQSIAFLASDGTIIAAHNIYKAGGSSTAVIEFTVNGSLKKTIQFTPDNTGAYACGTHGYNRIRKEGSKVTFHYAGSYYSFTDENIKTKSVSKVQIKIGGYQGAPLLTRNYIKDVEFKALNMSYELVDDEGFQAGQLITIDSVNENIDASTLSKYEQIGSVYPMIEPQTTETFRFNFSPWFDGTVQIVGSIREGWL